MSEELISRLETHFRLRPSASGLMLPPDPTEHELSPDGLVYGRPVRQAAVLVPVFRPKNGQPARIMLTLRSAQLRQHAGQVSFPGGASDPGDEGPIGTALRETWEETQLPTDAVEVVGTLPGLILPSAFHVTPVVGLIEPGPLPSPSPGEVEEIFYVPADILLDPANYRLASMQFQGRERQFMEMHYDRFRIWGATATILHHLATRLHTPLENP